MNDLFKNCFEIIDSTSTENKYNSCCMHIKMSKFVVVFLFPGGTLFDFAKASEAKDNMSSRSLPLSKNILFHDNGTSSASNPGPDDYRALS